MSLKYQNWLEVIQKLESTQAVINYLNQMQKVIAQSASQQINNSAPLSKISKSNKNLSLFLFGLGMIITVAGGLIVLLISHFKKQK